VSTLAIALRSRTFRSLSRHRNYRIFFVGQLVSLAGSWMQNIALAWLVLELSGSPIAVGALAFARFLPFTVFGLAAGVVADRVDSRKLVIATQAAAALVSITLAVVTLTGTATLPLVYVLAALGGLTLAFDAPGRQSLTYQMVGPNSLPNAVALNASLFNGSRVIGPAIAGLVIAAFGTGICFVVNAFSFIAVLAALASLRTEELHAVARDPSARVVEGVRRALAYVRQDSQLRTVLGVVMVVSTVGFNFHVLVPLLARRRSAWEHSPARSPRRRSAERAGDCSRRERLVSVSSRSRSRRSRTRCLPACSSSPAASRSRSSRRTRMRSSSSARPTSCAAA
jgi:MFS family permease